RLTAPPLRARRPEYFHSRGSPTMRNCFIFGLARITQKTIHSGVRARKFSIKKPQECPKSDQSSHSENIDFQPERVFQFVAGATAFDVQPGKACQCLENRSQNLVGLAEYVGVGHVLRITR